MGETSNKDGFDLPTLYSQGLHLMKKAESIPRGEKRQELYIDARRILKQAMEMVESLDLFSDNECINDISTNDLKYLLIPAYLAKITISSECGPNRLNTFTSASELIKKFFVRLSQYNLGDSNIERALRSDDVSSTSQSLESAIQTRNDKIEKYKKMKNLEDRLEELEKRLNAGEQVDEESAREYYLKLIEKWVDESYESLEREIKPGIFFERNRSDMGQSSNHKPPRQTFTIVKNELQKQVFGIGYPSRPTVTVDEFITKKISDGDLAFEAQKEVYANSLQRYAERPDLRREQEEASDEEHDRKEELDDQEELAKKRQWDEFKDENPRGSGNRHNMG